MHRMSAFIIMVIVTALLAACPRTLPADEAAELLKTAGVTGGLAVHVGCGDGKLAVAVATRIDGVVQGLAADRDTVQTARRHILDKGLCNRVGVIGWDGERLPYADNLVTLLIREDHAAVPDGEVMRVLAPHGVCMTRDGGTWVKKVKPRPDDIDEWTHYLHGPGGNAVAADRAAGPPRRFQWKAGPCWARLHDAPSSTSAMVAARDRVFYIRDEGPLAAYRGLAETWSLFARNAFNGILLWKRPMPGWGWKQWTANWHLRNNQPFQLPKRLVAAGDRVYVTLGFHAPVTALDAATGDIVTTYAGTDGADEILLHEGLLVIAINKTRYEPSKNNRTPVKKAVAAVAAKTGEIVWKSGDYVGITAKTGSIAPDGRLELAAGGGGVFLCDRNEIIRLDLQTGETAWRAARRYGEKQKCNFNTLMWQLPVMVYSDGVVLFAQPEGTTSFHSVPGTLYAWDAQSGAPLWQHRYGGWVHNTQPNVFVVDETVWVHEHQEGDVRKGHRMVFPKERKTKADFAVIGLDIRSGKLKKRIPTRTIFNVGHHHRCYRNKATERFLLTSRRGVEFIDIENGGTDLNHWVRGDCQLGIMPCNGLLYSTPHPCSCYISAKLNGYCALAPAPATREKTADPENPLVKGPAFGPVTPAGATDAMDWPAFRAGPDRGGSSACSLPAKLHPLWKVDFEDTVGPVSVAGGRVFVPVVDECRVAALDAHTGKPVWTHVTGGRVDTPPTAWENRVLFGSADGWVHCLRAADGKPAWRLRAAPRERLVCSTGRVESAWPVHGSVLVTGSAAYIAAGRSSYLDGGIHLYAVRPATGEIIQRRVLSSRDPKTGKQPCDPGFSHTMPGTLRDIMVGDGDTVWMRDEEVFTGKKSSRTHVCATGGMLDDSWFNRTTWRCGPVKHAQYLVFNEKIVCGIEAFSSTNRKAAFAPGQKGYRLFAMPLDRKAGRKAKKKDRAKGCLWSRRIPVRAKAMALAADTLLLAGPPDVIDPNDTLAAFEGRKGAVMWAVSAADGKKRWETKLDAPPAWDGMAVADDKLYMSMADGSVRCYGGAGSP